MWCYSNGKDGCVLSVCTDSLGLALALMKSCEAVTLDVRSYRSLNCYHTALTPLATEYIHPTLILACTTNKLLGLSYTSLCFRSCEYVLMLRILTLRFHFFFC